MEPTNRASANVRLRLACLISGGGRTMINLADHIDDGALRASIELVIASRECPGAQKARDRGFDTHVIARRDFPVEQAMHDRISSLLRERRIDLVCLCGYLRWFRVDPDFRGKVINIHPALLPDYGGPGLYGERVHEAVLKAGGAVSGCTVHLVDDVYDTGRRSCSGPARSFPAMTRTPSRHGCSNRNVSPIRKQCNCLRTIAYAFGTAV